jgi:hypothetical protein
MAEISPKTYTILAPQTGVTTAPDGYSIFNSKWYKEVVVAADNLAGAEEVDIYILVNSRYVLACDSEGDAVKLTATAPSRVLPGGPVYAFLKDATVGASGIFALLSLGNKRR